LGSGQNKRIDTSDIHKHLNFNQVTKIGPQLCEFIIHTEVKAAATLSDISAISVLSLLPDESYHDLELSQSYGKAGYMPDGVLLANNNDDLPAIYYIITNQRIGDIVANVVEKERELDAVEKALSEVPNHVIEITDASNNGFVF
jgi:hypothetical protein